MKLDYMIELEGGFRIHGSEELRSGCVRIRPVLPEGRVKAVTARVNITMAEDERFFVNGYQTWTYCPEQGTALRAAWGSCRNSSSTNSA